MSEIKPKSVIIDGKIHSDFKEHCVENKLKIGGVIENLMLLYLNNPKDIQTLMLNRKKNIL